METDMNEYKIYPYNVVSMLPPGNWGARFEGAEGLQALVCWALVETEGRTTIKGMVAAEQHQVLPCDCFSSFLCYEPTELPVSSVKA